ncbi:MAG: hypothetical protein HZB20_03040 [Chloroflexi bacterium]|nr:hypothetical protein [Chloroflexota bacterium]
MPSDDSGREGGETPATAVAIASFPYTDTGNTSDNLHDAVTMTGTPICTSPSFTTLPAKDVWYKFSLASPSTMSFSLCLSPWDTKLAVFIDNAGVVGNVVARDDDACNSPNGLASAINNCTLPAGDYFIVVDGYGASNQGAYTLNVTGPCVDPGCPAGYAAAFEIEPPCLDTNGGCNMPTPTFEPIALNTPLCGTTWADANLRDTDWFEVVLGASSTITVNGAAVCVPMAYTIVTGTCPATSIGTFNVAAGGTGSFTSACQLPGTYRVVAAPQGFTGFPCANLYHYGIEVRGRPLRWRRSVGIQ